MRRMRADMTLPFTGYYCWQLGGLGVSGQNVAKKARTRGFASLTLVRFAFVSYLDFYAGAAKWGQFWHVRTVT